MSAVIFYTGLVTILWFLGKIILFLALHLRPSRTSLDRYRHGEASWALITGGSGGIGFGFAQALLPRGFNVILLARRREQLEAARADLEREFADDAKGRVKIVVVDAVTGTAADLDRAIAELDRLNVTMLVNNVGGLPIQSPHFRALKDYGVAEVDETIDLNARFLARITCRMVPLLARNGPSLIVNLSSGAQVGIPWLVMYSATKGFVASFSKALSRELRAEGMPVDVVNLMPGDVRSQSHLAPLAWNVPTSRVLAEAAVGRIGTAVSRGMFELSPFWAHGLLLALLDVMPEKVKQFALVDEIGNKRRMFDKVE